MRPAIRRLLGYRQTGLPQVMARLGHEFRLDPERPEYHRVTLRHDGDSFVAVSTGSQASSRLLSATGANGLFVLEQAQARCLKAQNGLCCCWMNCGLPISH